MLYPFLFPIFSKSVNIFEKMTSKVKPVLTLSFFTTRRYLDQSFCILLLLPTNILRNLVALSFETVNISHYPFYDNGLVASRSEIEGNIILRKQLSVDPDHDRSQSLDKANVYSSPWHYSGSIYKYVFKGRKA